MPAGTDEEKATFWAQLMADLPGYLHWIRNEFVIPDHLRGERYGLEAFIHPHVTMLLDDLLPETRLLALIDHILFMDSLPEWHGTSELLCRQLGDDQAYGNQARQIATNSIYCGKLLAKLANSKPERVKEDRAGNCRQWQISRPPSPMPSMTKLASEEFADSIRDIVPGR